MLAPSIQENETARQLAVDRLCIVDTPVEEAYDSVTALLSQIIEMPVALITVLDNERNWLKSHHGLDMQESPRNISFCGHAINSNNPITIVNDARIDERFHDNPLVSTHGVVFYAGVPLKSHDSYRLGTLCVYDRKPRSLDAAEIASMHLLANIVEELLDQKLKNKLLQDKVLGLAQLNGKLDRFSRSVAHDIRTPLSGILLLTELLMENEHKMDTAATLDDLNSVKQSAIFISNYVDNLLTRDSGYLDTTRWFDRLDVFSELSALLVCHQKIKLSYPTQSLKLLTDRVSLLQILVNLASNSIKYNSNTKKLISIRFEELPEHYQFSVTDNGRGIRATELELLFGPTASSKGRPLQSGQGNSEGTGTGIPTIRALLSTLDGTLSATSTVGTGSCFTFTLKKFSVD